MFLKIILKENKFSILEYFIAFCIVFDDFEIIRYNVPTFYKGKCIYL